MLSLRAFPVRKGRGVAEPSGSLPTLSTPNRIWPAPDPHPITVQRKPRGVEAGGTRESEPWVPGLEDGWWLDSCFPAVIRRREVEPRNGKRDLQLQSQETFGSTGVRVLFLYWLELKGKLKGEKKYYQQYDSWQRNKPVLIRYSVVLVS